MTTLTRLINRLHDRLVVAEHHVEDRVAFGGSVLEPTQARGVGYLSQDILRDRRFLSQISSVPSGSADGVSE